MDSWADGWEYVRISLVRRSGIAVTHEYVIVLTGTYTIDNIFDRWERTENVRDEQ